MARICGICPVSHLIASAKACDEILGVAVPPVALKLRRVMNLAQIVQSHSLSYFHLTSPDLLLGFDSDPANRNILGVAAKAPEMARDGIALRRFGQEIIEKLGGKRVHPAWVVPGGVSAPLQAEQRDAILATVPDAHARAARALEWYKENMASWVDEAAVFANFPSMFMGLVHESGNAAYSDGGLTMVGSDGKVHLDKVDPRPYWDYFGEAVEPWTYLKFPYYKPIGYPDGMYRVGPLARVNVVDQLGTPAADAELAEFRWRLGRYPCSSFHYHWARLIEILHCVDMVGEILSEPDILSEDVRARAAINRRRRSGSFRGAPGDFVPPLPGRQGRCGRMGQPDHRHRAQQPGHEPGRAPGRPPLHQGRARRRGHAQPVGSRHPGLRPVPIVLDPRRRADAPTGRDRQHRRTSSPPHRPDW